MVYTTVRAAEARPGTWVPRVRGEGGLGFLVLEGLILARNEIAEHASVDIRGPGDLIRPLDGEGVGRVALQVADRLTG